MKYCRTLEGLLAAIEKKEACSLKITSAHGTGGNGYIIYQKNGTNLIVTKETYAKIEPHLEKN